jgi:hypothetical protein
MTFLLYGCIFDLTDYHKFVLKNTAAMKRPILEPLRAMFPYLTDAKKAATERPTGRRLAMTGRTVSALVLAELSAVIVMAIAYAGFLIALAYSNEKIMWLCLGAAILADLAIFFAYRCYLQIQRQQCGKPGEQITTHRSQIL